MSVSYWMIEGIGLIADDIAHRIDRAKAAKFLHEQFPERQDADEVCRSKDFLKTLAQMRSAIMAGLTILLISFAIATKLTR